MNTLPTPLTYLDVEVTQEDIDKNGHRPEDCPIQRAITRQYPEFDVHVYSWSLSIDGIVFAMPYEVGRWIHKYDVYMNISPDKFKIPIYNMTIAAKLAQE
jgi:hypothetical protein